MADKLTIGRSYNFSGALWSGTFTQTFTLRFVPDGYGKPMTLNRLTLPVETYNCSSIILSATSGQTYFTISIVTNDIPPQTHIFTSNGNNLEFYNAKLSQITGGYTDGGNALLLQRFTEIFGITLYNLTGEKHIVDKTSYLSNATMMNGQLTEDCDILNPSLLIQHPQFITFGGAENNFTWNYCYIPLFKRYYFITKITSVRNQIWRIDLHVDVLYSYLDDIGLQSGYIRRSEGNPNGVDIVDDRYKFEVKPSFSFTDVTGGVLSNITLDVNLNATKRCGCLAVLNETAQIGYTNIITSIPGLPSINAGNFQNALAYNYAISPADWFGVARNISQQQALADFVFNVTIYPFDFADALLYDDTPTNIVIGSTDTGITSRIMVYDFSKHLIIADFTLPSYTTFMDLEPYTECEVYIPYYDNTYKFNLKRTAGHRILIYYTTQFSNGDSSVYVYDYTDEKILMCSPVQLAQKMAVSVTNLHEITIERYQTGISAINNSLNSWASMLFHGASGNAIGGFRGIQSFGKQMVDLAFAEDILQDRANIEVTSANTGTYNPQKVILITKQMVAKNGDSSVFIARNGYPIKEWGDLSDYSGYTEIEQIHYAPSSQTWITTDEIDEIENLAYNGIIL